MNFATNRARLCGLMGVSIGPLQTIPAKLRHAENRVIKGESNGHSGGSYGAP
jgi:hypothetical protein